MGEIRKERWVEESETRVLNEGTERLIHVYMLH